MNFQSLVPHPDNPASRVEAFAVEWERTSDQLWLRYQLDVPIDHLLLSLPAAADRTDNLWLTTCFELFVRRPGEAAYAEFNFAPSGQWAAYQFSNYRNSLGDLHLDGDPDIGMDAGAQWLNVEATLRIPEPWALTPLQIALSAVIEEVDGAKSYWALAHPAEGPPDFHHPDCFALHLPAPDAS